MVKTYQSNLFCEDLLKLVQKKYENLAITRCQFLTYGQNDTFLLHDCTEKKYILRVYTFNWRTVDDVLGEISHLDFLTGENITVASVIRDIHNEALQKIHCAEGLRLAVLFEYADGLPLKHRENTKNGEIYGDAIGAMHASALKCIKSYKRFELNKDYLIINPLECIKSIYGGNPSCKYIIDISKECLDKFDEKLEESNSSIFCHGDLHGGNALYSRDGVLTLIDFDCGGIGPIEYDLAAFRRLSIHSKNSELWDAFFSSYSKKSELKLSIDIINYFAVVRQIWLSGLHCFTADRFGHGKLNEEYFEGVINFFKLVECYL